MSAYLPSALVAAMIVVFAYTQSRASEVKTWTQTSVEDFRHGTLQNVVVRDIDGGALTLAHPMRNVVEAQVDNTLPLGTALDRDGNYLKLNRQGGNLYAQRYRSSSDSIGAAFRVNESEGRVAAYSEGYAISEDGSFAVVWTEDIEVRVQFYNAAGSPMGGNHKVNGGFPRGLGIVADEDAGYWVVWWNNLSESVFHGPIYAQHYDHQGNQLGENIKLADGVRGFGAVASDHIGHFIVVWGERRDRSQTESRYMAHRFSIDNGSAVGSPFQVDDKNDRLGIAMPDIGNSLVDIDCDRRGSFVVAWHNSIGISAQYYDHRALPIGWNFRVVLGDDSHPLNTPDVRWKDNGHLRIAWARWMGGNYGGWDTYTNEWEYSLASEGVFTSEAFDTGPGGAYFERLFWTLDGTQDTSSVRFKIRTSQTLEGIREASWYGPGADPSGDYVLRKGERIHPLHNGDRYCQYQAFFSMKDPAEMPVLKDVTFSFRSVDSLPPETPAQVRASSVYLAGVYGEGSQLV